MQAISRSKINPGILSAGIAGVAALRIFMAPYPNIEPVMLFTLAAGLALGPLAGLLTGAGSMIVSNVFLSAGPLTFPWIFHMPLVTVYTSLAYGLVGLIAGILGLARKGWGRRDMTLAAAGLTIFYDAVTCVCFALQFYGPAGIPLALSAQVPFTMLHLSNAVLVFVLGPYALGLVRKAGELSLTGLPKDWKTHT